MSKTIRIKIDVDAFKVSTGHANWKKRKMGIMTPKGSKVSRSLRNRVRKEDIE